MKKYLFGLSFILPFIIEAQVAPIMNSISGFSSVCSSPSSPKIYTAMAINSPNSYSWSVNPSLGVIIANPTNSITNINFPNSYSTYTVFCYAINSFGNSNVVSKVILVSETPMVSFSGGNTFCQGSSTNLSASATNISASSTLIYNWFPSYGLNSYNSSVVVASPSITTTYTLHTTFGACTSTNQITINVLLCLGIDLFQQNVHSFLRLYPNPTRNYCKLISSVSQNIIILNDLGQTVKYFFLMANEETLINNLDPGIYIIATENEKKKLIITK
jgi:hypothetical protein